VGLEIWPVQEVKVDMFSFCRSMHRSIGQHFGHRLAAIAKLHLSLSRRNGAGLPAASIPEGQPSASLSQDLRNGSAGRMDRAQRKIDLGEFIILLFRSLNEAAIDPFSPFFSIGTMNGRLITHEGRAIDQQVKNPQPQGNGAAGSIHRSPSFTSR